MHVVHNFLRLNLPFGTKPFLGILPNAGEIIKFLWWTSDVVHHSSKRLNTDSAILNKWESLLEWWINDVVYHEDCIISPNAGLDFHIGFVQLFSHSSIGISY